LSVVGSFFSLSVWIKYLNPASSLKRIRVTPTRAAYGYRQYELKAVNLIIV
jgi:hypothetical protein